MRHVTKSASWTLPFVLFPLVLFALAEETEAADKPNVLWLISDDHAAYVTGCYGEYGRQDAASRSPGREPSKAVRSSRC